MGAVKKTSRKRLKIWIVLAVVAVIGVFVLFVVLPGGTAATDVVPQTAVLERADLSRVLSASGVVRSASSEYVFSVHSRPVQEIFAEVGDRVEIGDVLARLDMSNIENEIGQTKLNLLNAQRNAAEEGRANANSVANAQTSLESARITLQRQTLNAANAARDLNEAAEDMNEPFDAAMHDRAVADSRLTFQRRAADLENVMALHDIFVRDSTVAAERRRADLDDALYDFETALRELETVQEDFDGERHLRTVEDARIQLERRLYDLAEAEADLEEERQNAIEPFDETVFRNAVNDAERNLNRRSEDVRTAQRNLSAAWDAVDAATAAGDVEALAAAHAQRISAQAALDNAHRAEADAQTAFNRARNDLTRARDDYYEREEERRDNVISGAERAYTNARNAADDAQRALSRAIDDLDRALDDAETLADDNLTRERNNFRNAERTFNDSVRNYDRAIHDRDQAVTNARQALRDARRAYERAVLDRERAEEDFTDANETRLRNAQRAYDDSRNQLAAAQNSLRQAEETLNQAATRPAASEISAEQQMLNLERLNNHLAEGLITAPAPGVVTQVNASVGAAATGVLFIIEDMDNLYVSANIREHSLGELQAGMNAFVTTEVTGNAIYDAKLSFISPRAVSPVGSTSVEFEIRAAMLESDVNIRIGMNAFINVIIEQRENVFSVPLSAVVTNERGSFVYVLEYDETGIAQRRETAVNVGLRTTTHAEIYGNGIGAGMVVLTRPLT